MAGDSPLGWFIFQQFFIFHGGTLFSHAFNHAEFNGTKIFEIQKYLGIAKNRQKLDVFIKMTKKG